MRSIFTSTRWPIAILVLGVVCFGAVAVLALAAALTRPQAAAQEPLRLSIRLPQGGARLSVGDSASVLVQASGPGPITRYELWVDGVLERVVVPEPGENLDPMVQVSWRPMETGTPTLMARAYGPDGQSGRSRPVVVEVVTHDLPETLVMDLVPQTGDTLETISASTGVATEEIAAANPGWSGALEPGQAITIPLPSDALPPGGVGDDRAGRADPEAEANLPPPPLPPDLPARPGAPSAGFGGDCQVHLDWPASDRAEGYRIYRFAGHSPDFAKVGETTAGDNTFDDRVPLAGGYQYLIVAFNDQGSVEGDPLRVDVSAEDCPAPALSEDGQAWLDLELLSLTTDPGLDRLYCYASPLPGAAFSRLPAGDDEFLTSSDGTWDIGRFAAGIGRLGFLQSADRAARLQLECWGWEGGSLSRLGSLDLEHPQSEWDGRELSARTDRFDLLYRLLDHTGEIPQMRPVIFEAGPPRPEFFRHPEDTAECLDGHVIAGRAADAESRGEIWAATLACLSVDPIDLSVWEWTERADPRYSVHDLRSFRIYFDPSGRDVQDVPSSEWQVYAEVSPAIQTYPLLRPACEETYTYWVTAVGIPSPGLPEPAAAGEGPGFGEPIPEHLLPLPETLESPPSNVLTVGGSDCPEIQEVLVELTLDSIEVGHTWDSCIDIDWECEDVDLEAYGSGTFFRIREDGSSEEVASVTFWTRADRCGGLVACMGLGTVFANDTIHLDHELMAVCDVRGCGGLDDGNNTIQIWVGDGDDIGFDFALRDDDDDSGDDIWCGTSDDDNGWAGAGKFPEDNYKSFHTGVQSIDDWAALQDYAGHWNNNGLDRQDAECTVNVGLTAIEVAR